MFTDVEKLTVRYSSSQALHEKLKKVLPAAVVESFPEFPPPRHFADMLNDEANIKQRYEDLRIYFCRVLTTPAVIRSLDAMTILGLKDLYVAPSDRARRNRSSAPRIKAPVDMIGIPIVAPGSPNRAIKSVSRKPRSKKSKGRIELKDETESVSSAGSGGSGMRPPRPPSWDLNGDAGIGAGVVVQPLRLVDQAIEWRDQAKQWWAPVEDDPECEGGRPSDDPDAALQLEWARPRSRSARAAETSALAPALGARPMQSAPNTPVKGREPHPNRASSDEGWDIASASSTPISENRSSRSTEFPSNGDEIGSSIPREGKSSPKSNSRHSEVSSTGHASRST